MKVAAKKALDNAPYRPARLTSEIVYGVKALRVGEATAEQQAKIFEWLILEACKKDDMSYRPGSDGDRDTVFAEGKRFVALQVLKALNMPAEAVAEMRTAETEQRASEGDEIGRRD